MGRPKWPPILFSTDVARPGNVSLLFRIVSDLDP
jgi:hypothetical protein